MTTKTTPAVKQTLPTSRAAIRRPSPQPKTAFAPLAKRLLPDKSVTKAAKAFKNFSLSRFAKDAAPPKNYVDRLKVKDPAAVQTLQRQIITQQLEKLPETDAQNTGMTLAFPLEKLDGIEKSLPGITDDGGKIKLDHLLTLLRGRMNGTAFYSIGNAVMRRLTAEMQARSKARAIIERIKKGTGTAQSGATQTVAIGKNPPRTLAPEKKGRSNS